MIKLTDEEFEVLRKLEEELWREETRFDQRRMNEVIAEDFFEFGMSGRFYRREDTLAIARQPIDAVFPLPNFQARLLAPDIAGHSIQRWRLTSPSSGQAPACRRLPLMSNVSFPQNHSYQTRHPQLSPKNGPCQI